MKNVQVLANNREILKTLCIAKNKYGMFIDIRGNSSDEHYFNDLYLAAPWLNEKDVLPTERSFGILCFYGRGFVFFESEEQMNKCFGETECDFPKGNVSVYALTCDSTGKILSENT